MSRETPNFLGVDPAGSGAAPARCRILPVPYEATVSYEGGTAAGPRAILEASTQVELFDRTCLSEACFSYGVETLPAFDAGDEPGEEYVARLADHVAGLFDRERLLVGLGGEHTVTVGLARGTRRASGRPLTLVQIDAHADLRDAYEGNPYSHACISRRLLDEGVDRVVQLGVRSVCTEEFSLIGDDPRVHVFWGDDIQADGKQRYLSELEALVQGTDVYFTIDVDGLDPSVVPATGTPEPNGLKWAQAIACIETTARAATIVGLDVTELAPRPNLHAADFAVAKLTYRAINIIANSRGWMAGGDG